MSGRGPVGVGIIGAGVISGAYLTNLTAFPDVTVHIVGDLYPEVAAARAAEYGIAQSGTPDDVLAHPDVEIVVNLTIPAAHVEVAGAAVAAGKHVFGEKPFSLDRPAGAALLAAADAVGLRLGCAPDTVLGAGIQTARRVIERGDIGRPLGASTVFQNAGSESWHPNPAFLYQRGAGPLFDMGPYYLTTLVEVFGAVAAVAAVGSTARPTRVIGSGPKAGEEFAVEVPTYVCLLTTFVSGATGQSTFSFDSPLARVGVVEITGSEATLAVPDPNRFGGELKIRRTGADDWESIDLTGSEAGRGMGVLDMARSIRAGVPHRVQGARAFHVLDVMVSALESVESGAFVTVGTSTEPSEPLPPDWDPTVSTLS